MKVKYEDLNLPCIRLNKFNQPQPIIVSQFDYGKRVRRGTIKNPQMTFSIVLANIQEQKDFSEFYYNKISEIQSFLLDQQFGLYTSKDKEVRFAGPLQIQQLGNNQLLVECVLELVDPTAASHTCILVPSNDLYPDNTLYPNVCPKTTPTNP